MIAKPILRGWTFDTIHVFSQADASRLLAASWIGPKRGLWRYVSRGQPSPGDITVVERDNIFAGGWDALGLVQHVDKPSWIADSTKGTDYGTAAARHAQLVEYPVGCHIVPDIEGLGDAGAPVYDFIAYWSDAVMAQGYLPLPYDGYDDGLAAQWKTQLVTRGIVRASDWWSDFGPRSLPPGRSWVGKQHEQTTVAGIGVDPDEVLVDNVLVLMGQAA